jgi:hypothetical protein
MSPSDPIDAAKSIGRTLDAMGVPYAIGGALAHGLWGVPRATTDVDINIFVADDAVPGVVDALIDLGVVLDRERARQESEANGLFIGHFGRYRIDLFTPSIEFAREAQRTRVQKVVDGQPLWFLSAEALAVFKMMFFRVKDILDVDNMIAVQGTRLDTSYVRRHLASIMGDDDERVRRWDELVAAHNAPQA